MDGLWSLSTDGFLSLSTDGLWSASIDRLWRVSIDRVGSLLIGALGSLPIGARVVLWGRFVEPCTLGTSDLGITEWNASVDRIPSIPFREILCSSRRSHLGIPKLADAVGLSQVVAL
jgi:hypothetical protein